MPSELIIQLQKTDGTFSCEKFDNLPSPKSAYIAICFTDNAQSEQLAIELRRVLINSISNIKSNFIKSTPPCGSKAVDFNQCMSLGIFDNLKLLIVISDGMNASFRIPGVLNWQYTILPILEEGKPYSLPNPFNVSNALFWRKNIDEAIPTIFGLIGISEVEQRIFISYRRSDTSAFAEQLFDRLNHEGFEVFLDRFSINPSINFQIRLYQELADKAMVLLIESPNYQKSQWVQYEIDFAKKYRLGILSLNTNNSPKVFSVDDEYRRMLTLDHYGILETIELDYIIKEIKLQHSISLYRMRNYLNVNIFSALEDLGANPSIDSKGFISISNKKGNQTYKIWATPRPPKVNDFHYSDISNSAGEKIIVGPEFIEENRGTLNKWLCKKCHVDFYNEGQILEMSDTIYP